MGTWSSRGLRGSVFEELINHTNEIYRRGGLALIQKVPTPITPVEMDGERHITLAYFDRKSTVDYIGVVQGRAVSFDAKECNCDRFPMANIHEHQLTFMNEFEAQDGVAFFVIYFKHTGQFYYMRLSEANYFHERAMGGGRKSFLISELDRGFFFSDEGEIPVPYLDMLDKDLEERKANRESFYEPVSYT